MTELKVQITDLHPDPNNLRESVDEDAKAFKELTDSIRSVGVLEPLIVRPRPDGGFWIVAGHRRHAAATAAELTQVDCIVRDISDTEATEMQLIENLMRVDINPVEEASGYFRLVEMGMNRKALAERIGRSNAHIASRMRLLELPVKVQGLVRNGSITAGDAALLAGWDGDDLDALIEVAQNHGNLQWRIERAEEARKRRGDVEAMVLEAKTATGLDPVVMFPHDWTNGEAKSWRELTDLCSETEIAQHRMRCPDIHRVVVLSGQRWFEATTLLSATRKALELKTTLTEAEAAEREAKKAEREHKAARLAAMRAACSSKLPVTANSLGETVRRRYLASVHQDIRKAAAQILEVEVEALEGLLDQGPSSANRVALALTMAEDAARHDRVDSLDDELREWGVLA